MNTTKNRAPVGGVTGVNGEFYQGGRFLPSDKDRPKQKGSKAQKVAKVEIEPCLWVLSREDEGYTSIYSRIGHLASKDVGAIAASNQALAYYRVSRKTAETYLSLYKMGYRFIAEAEPYLPIESSIGEYLID